MTEFTTKNGITLKGEMIRVYKPYEAPEVRYTFIGDDHKEYRCVRRGDKYVEYVV